MIMLLKTMVFVMTVLSSSAMAEPLRVVGANNVAPDLRWQVVNDTVMGGVVEPSETPQGGASF